MGWPATARDDSYGGKRASAYAAIMEVLSTGGPLDPTPDTIHPIGFLQTAKYDRTVTTEGEEDVFGTKHNEQGTTDAKLVMKIMQRDLLHLEAPKSFTGYARVYHELTGRKIGPNPAAFRQIAVVCAAKFDGSFGWDASDLYREWTMTCSPNTTGSTLTIALTAFTGALGAGVGNATIGANEYEDIVEF